MSGYESDTCGRSYTIRIRYVWTQIFLYPHKKICGYKNLRIRVDGALNGHFLFSFTDPDPKVCKDNTKTADCEDWKRAGFCTEHPAMIVHCKKTCGFCSSGKKTIFFAIIPAASKRRRNLYCDYSNRGTSFFFYTNGPIKFKVQLCNC